MTGDTMEGLFKAIEEGLFKAIEKNPTAALLGIGMTLTWLRVMRELRAAGVVWEDAVCVCIPSSIATVGFVQGFDFANRHLAPDVVERWDDRDVVEREVRRAADAFRRVVQDETAEEDDRILGLAMYTSVLSTIPAGGETVRAQGGDALSYALAILNSVEVDPDDEGFPVRFRGHGEAHGDDAMSIAIPRLYLESKAGGAS